MSQMQDASIIKIYALVNLKLVNKSNRFEFLFCKSAYYFILFKDSNPVIYNF